MKYRAVFGLFVIATLSGCISRPVRTAVPVMRVTLPGPSGTPAPTSTAPAPTPAQIANCERIRQSHNTWSLLGVLFGGVAGASGTADSTTSNKDVQVGIGIGAAVSGIFAAVSTAEAGLQANAYSTANCDDVLSGSSYEP